MRVRVLTYNIHKGIGGRDRRYDLSRIVQVIGHYQPDLALLQEVDDGVPRSRGDSQAQALAEHLGFAHVCFQPNVRLRRGVYGNAILSRWALHDTVDVELTVPPKKRRRAQLARVHLEEGGRHRTLIVANLHLGLSGFERRIQLRRLFLTPALARAHHDTPCVLGGDFNDFWGGIGERLMKPAGFAPATRRVRTFPARSPIRALDTIYYRGECALDRAFAGRVEAAREASDHLPLVAELDVRVGD